MSRTKAKHRVHRATICFIYPLINIAVICATEKRKSYTFSDALFC